MSDLVWTLEDGVSGWKSGGGPADVFVQADDPGAVGAGKIWVKLGDPGNPPELRIRNNADTGWRARLSAVSAIESPDEGDGFANLNFSPQTVGTGTGAYIGTSNDDGDWWEIGFQEGQFSPEQDIPASGPPAGLTLGSAAKPWQGATLKTLNLTDLPTADPLVAGAVWNSSGTLKVSAG